MSSIELLDRTRRIRAVLRESEEKRVSFDKICVLMGKIVFSSVILISARGKILGRDAGARYPAAFSAAKGGFIDDTINARLLSVLSTRENVRAEALGMDDGSVQETEILIAPVEMGRMRSGTLLFFRRNRTFSVDDIILCEYASTVVSLELMRSLSLEEASERNMEEDLNDALEALSATELIAAKKVFEELDTDGGVIVASRVSREAGITRSVIVNALKKLEGAGIIDIKSQGVKGTYIKIENPEIFERLDGVN